MMPELQSNWFDQEHVSAEALLRHYNILCKCAISSGVPARRRLHVPLENLRSPILMGESLGLESLPTDEV